MAQIVIWYYTLDLLMPSEPQLLCQGTESFSRGENRKHNGSDILMKTETCISNLILLANGCE